jgi:hypothetical protein
MTNPVHSWVWPQEPENCRPTRCKSGRALWQARITEHTGSGETRRLFWGMNTRQSRFMCYTVGERYGGAGAPEYTIPSNRRPGPDSSRAPRPAGRLFAENE